MLEPVPVEKQEMMMSLLLTFPFCGNPQSGICGL